jgi:predicted oxidoreductase
MAADRSYQADVVIAGGGLAGIVLAYELLGGQRSVLLIDKDTQQNFGGLARESFGGIHMIDTPYQRRMGIRDNPGLAYRDWQSVACFTEDAVWPRKWARFYCENSAEYIFEFLDSSGIKFLPLVNWPERGLYVPGNTVPRWHIAWGTGKEIVVRLLKALDVHTHRGRLRILFAHEVNGIEIIGGRAVAFTGKTMDQDGTFRAQGEHLVVASGGMCGGDLSKVRKYWYKAWGEPPRIILNGAHRYGDGLLQDVVAELGGTLTNLDRHWHYAAGVHHPARRKPDDGLSLVPPKSALWMNALGRRIGPMPMVALADTRHLVQTVAGLPGQYSWQVMNWKIAARELAVSGCDYMTAFVKKSRTLLLRQLLFGNNELVERLIRECPDDIAVADSLPALMEGMEQRSLFGLRIDRPGMEADIRSFDEMIGRGPACFNDEQLRRIMNCRSYRGDRIRTCKFQKILDRRAMPLIAIREFILSRKSLGGIQTDLGCRVLKNDGTPIPGLYAVGEAAGFGGGGIHGQGSLEGTFLGSCVLTGRMAARAIAGNAGV